MVESVFTQEKAHQDFRDSEELRALRVHPELAGTLAALPERPANPYLDIEATRAGFKAFLGSRVPDNDPRLTVRHMTIPGPDGNTIDVQVLRPAGAEGPLPGVLYIHGGGFAYGELDGPSPMARDACVAAGAVVVNVHYRLAPEHRYPAGVEDCYAALRWMAATAGELGIDAGRIAVTGASAGGCLSAAVCLMARDRQGPPIAFQGLLIPCLDDRARTASMRRIADPRITNGVGVRHMWDTYLGADRGPDVPAYAAPARATDLSGLPPAYVLTCGLDPLRDEGLDYARRLTEADVPVEVKDVPGAWHLFEAFAPDTEPARRTTEHWLAALRVALRG
ncbi:alpha/beta hydrolase [Streptomyces piniterrae]|uniref:Alpha/beta hydrolase n=1 Tax=Streptomyces piniterrae TaxID=2571125 RepID=A0A4U0MMS2_9ACTN|nr:alpha/beta hydrolase [Streptomyces piniterrae]TJZ41933.1 alpha/beta hydrolase [Streptomyces piniterrae]